MIRPLCWMVALASVSALLVGSSVAQSPSGEKQMMAQGELRAFVSGADWCMDVVHTIVRAPTSKPFREDRLEAQRMIGHLRAALSIECPEASAILIDGFAGENHVYAGLASKDGDWVLEEASPPTLATAAAECDVLAAHPDDPERYGATGMLMDEDISAAMAIPACVEALKENPDDPVYKFQLGRAYWKAERYEEAIELFAAAAEDDHGGALAYLGDAVLYGVAGLEPDPEMARDLYTRAAEEGFEPAAALANEIVADAQPAEEDSEPPQKDFHHPKLIHALADGQPQAEGVWLGRMLVYAFGSASGVMKQCPDLKPKGFEPKEAFLRAFNAKLTFTEKLNLSDSIDKGTLEPFQNEAWEDGAKLVEMKSCAGREPQTLVQTVMTHYRAS